MTQRMNAEIIMPEGVSFEANEDYITVKGPKGEIERAFRVPILKINSKDRKIIISAFKEGKRCKMILNTWIAHLTNMVEGVTKGHEYELKICSGHFPMSVSVKGDKFEVKNFLGEKVPRVIKLKEGAEIKIEGDIIKINSPNKEVAGQVAADIEQLTRITNRDIRIFQDGIYIIKKSGKSV